MKSFFRAGDRPAPAPPPPAFTPYVPPPPRSRGEALALAARRIGSPIHVGILVDMLESWEPGSRSPRPWRRPSGPVRPVRCFDGGNSPGSTGDSVGVLVGPGWWRGGYNANGWCDDLEARPGEVLVPIAEGDEYTFSRYARGEPAALAAWLRSPERNRDRSAQAAIVEAVEIPRGPADYLGAAIGFTRWADYERIAALAAELGYVAEVAS
jgi:hypothetical protein